MAKLTIFENELNAIPEKQLQQVNLALQAISAWGKRLSSSTLTYIKNDDANSTTSTTYDTMNGYSSTFTNVNPTVRIDVTINIASVGGGGESLAISIDDTIVRQVQGITAGLNTFFYQDSLRTGTHKIDILWKLNSGTLTKRTDGGSQMLITNLIS